MQLEPAVGANGAPFVIFTPPLPVVAGGGWVESYLADGTRVLAAVPVHAKSLSDLLLARPLG